MGEHHIESSNDGCKVRALMRALPNDLAALERMLGEGRIESGMRRIGADDGHVSSRAERGDHKNRGCGGCHGPRPEGGGRPPGRVRNFLRN